MERIQPTEAPTLGLPKLIDEYNLCAILGFSGKFPWFVVHHPEMCYLKFWIDKSTKKIVTEFNPELSLREINAPTKALKELQGRLAYMVFNKLPKHEANFAYMKGKNIKMAADKLAGNDLLIRIDLKDFFPSHSLWYVKNRLHELTGYSEEICWFMARICTLNKKLPQGAVTSPMLSIVLNHDMDVRITEIAAKYGMEYARYADDLCFAGADRSNKMCWDFIHEIRGAIRPFKFNWDKVAIMRNSAYSYVHGVQVDGVLPAWYAKYSDTYQLKPNEDGVFIHKLGHEEMYPAEKDLIAADMPANCILREKRWYVQSIQRMLGLHLTAGVKYPRGKYNKMRMEAMLLAKGSNNVNPHKFRGKLAFMRMVDPAKATKIEEVLRKWES